MEDDNKVNERQKKGKGRKKRKEKYTSLLDECKREIEIHEKIGIEVPDEIWAEFEEIEEKVEEGDYTDTAERIASLMDKLRMNKEKGINAFRQKLEEVLSFLRTHGMSCEECEKALSLVDAGQLGAAKELWLNAKEEVERKISTLKKAIEEVKKAKELIEYTATHKINVENEKFSLARAEEMLAQGRTAESVETLQQVRKSCEEKLGQRFNEEVKKVEELQGLIPGLEEILKKSRAAFESHDYYNAFGILASAYASISRVDTSNLKAQIADLKILLNEIKTLSGYLPHIEDCEKEIARRNLEQALKIFLHVKQETTPVFERDFGRIMSRTQAISQTLAQHGIMGKEIEELSTEAQNYRARGEYGKAILTARQAMEAAEKFGGEIVKNLTKSFGELRKSGVVQGLSVQQIKKIETALGSDVHEALKQAFQMKEIVDTEIKKQIEPVENTLFALEKIVKEMQESGLNMAESNALILKTRSFLESYQFKQAEQTLSELTARVQNAVASTIKNNLPQIQKDIRALSDQALDSLLDEVKSGLERGDFYTAWGMLKVLNNKVREVTARSVEARLQHLSEIVAEFAKSGIKFSLPEISPSDPLALAKIENFVSVCQDTVREIVSAKIENAKKLIENAEKMRVKIEIDDALISDLNKLLEGNTFTLETAKAIGGLNARIEEASKKLADIALKEIEMMDKTREKLLSLGFKTEKYDTKVHLAHERIEKGRLYEAWLVANRANAEMSKDLHEKFSGELGYVNNLVKEFSKLDVDTLAIKVDLENAKILLAKKDYLALREVLGKIQNNLSEFIGSRVKEEFAKLEEYVETCIKFGVVPEEYRTVLHGIQSMLKDKRVLDAHMQIRDARDFLERATTTAYENRKSEVGRMLQFGEKIGLKESINFEEIDGIFNEDRVLGLEQISNARERVINRLKDTVASEISTLKRQFQVCRERGINCESQSMMVEDALKMLERGRVEEGYALVLEAKASLLTVLEDVIIKRLEEVKPEIEMLKKHGLYSHSLETKMKEVQEFLTNREIVKAYATYFSLRTELESLLKKSLSEIVEHYKIKLREYENLDFKLERARQMLSQIIARSEGEVQTAYAEIGKLDAVIHEEVIEQLNQKISLAGANMAVIEKEVENASHYRLLIEKTVNEMNAGNLLSAIRAMNEFSSAYSRLRERFYDYIEEIRESNKLLAEMGMSVENLEIEIENFEKSIEQNSFFSIAQRITEWQIYLRGVLRDKFLWEIGEVRRGLEQLLAGKDESIAKLLDEAGVMVEEQRYGEARVNIAKAKSALAEQSRSVFEQTYNELMQEIERCNGVGIDTSQAERFIENFRAEAGAMNFYAAKWNLDNAREVLLKAEEEAAGQAIHTLSLALEPYSNIFPDDFVKYYKLLEQAMLLFKEKKFVECTRIAYKTNFEFVTTISERIRSTIEYTRKLIEEFTQKGLDMEAARNLLNESIYHFNSSDFISAVQKASEARTVAEESIQVYIQQKFGEVLSLMKEANAIGVETKKVDEELQKAQKFIDEHNYLESAFALNSAYIECITQMQKIIQNKITEMEHLAQEFVTNGVFIPNEVYLYIERAKYSTSYGQFGQANVDIETARKMLLDILGTLAADRILAVKKIGDMGISIGCPMKITLKNYHELTEAITKIEVSKALDLCRNIEADAWKELYDYTHSIILEINTLIQIAEEYRVPHTTISESISQAEMHASWHNYPTAYQILTNAKKVISDLLGSTIETRLEENKARAEMLAEILGVNIDREEITKCEKDLKEMKIAEAHMRLKKIEEAIARIGAENEKKVKEFVDEKFGYARGMLEEIVKIGIDAKAVSDMLARVEERRLNKDYLNAAVKLNTFMKALERDVEKQFINARADLEGKFRTAKEMEIDLGDMEKVYAEISQAKSTEEKIKALAKILEMAAEVTKQGIAYVEAKLNSYLELNKNPTPEVRLKLDALRGHLEKKDMVEAYTTLKTLK